MCQNSKSYFLYLFIVFSVSTVFFVFASDYRIVRRDYAKLKRVKWGQMRKNGTYGFCSRRHMCHSVSRSLGYIVSDIGCLHKNLFSWDSIKIATFTFPIFIGARMIDERLQKHFFDEEKQKNINKPPSWCKNLAKYSIAPPILFLGSKAFFSRDPEEQITAQVMLTGMPFVLITKDLIKKLRFDICLRPHHEKFSPEVRCTGGFPSGHLAELTYLAVLYGVRYGPTYGVPLGSLAVFVGATFLACNRHYISQMIAGATFGAMYAVAANKVIDSYVCFDRSVDFGMCMSKQGGPQLTFDMKF